MLRSIRSGTIVLLACLFIGQYPLKLAAAQSMTLAPESSLWLVGDSTLHPYTSRTTDLKVAVNLGPQASTAVSAQAQWDAILEHGALTAMDLSIPVRSLKSHESGLDKNMYKAMKADQYPTIDFHLIHYDVTKSTASENAWLVQAAGTLQIAGHEQAIALNGTLTPALDSLQVQGNYTLLMTNYGIKPPSLMMGTIKVKDPVTIHFDLKLQAAGSNEPQK